jgi:antitoxin (DNA-binding transcriptional repressor) of toxin-antitoxin stability system
LIITRHGRRIARLIPETEHRQAEIDEALAAIKALPSRRQHLSAAKLIAARDEGRKR